MPMRDAADRDARRRHSRAAQQALAAAGVETPARDARLLVAAATGLGAAELICAAGSDASRTERRQRLAEFIERRCAREPVSRILGEREFFGRTFALSPATLDPRPDSETLIEAALAIVDAEAGASGPLRILDVGTGSGCLLVTLLAELPLATGVGTDIARRRSKWRSATPTAAASAGAPSSRSAMRSTASKVRSISSSAIRPTFRRARSPTLAPEVRDYDPRRGA